MIVKKKLTTPKPDFVPDINPESNPFKAFWQFLKADTWQSWVVSLVLLVIIIKFAFFPLLAFTTGTQLPLVVVESCSMYHSSDLESWWDQNKVWYLSRNISKEQFESFNLKNGLNKGDILFIVGVKEPKLGDIIIFNAKSAHPIIHRVVTLNPLGTKGDNGATNPTQLQPGVSSNGVDETDIKQSQLVGKAAFKLAPLLGWIKLIFFEPLKPASERGFCK